MGSVLSFLGGINVIFFTVIQFLIGGYQEFRFKESLIKTFYTYSAEIPTLDQKTLEKDPSNTKLHETLQNRPR